MTQDHHLTVDIMKKVRVFIERGVDGGAEVNETGFWQSKG